MERGDHAPSAPTPAMSEEGRASEGRAGLAAGARASLPIAASVFAYGLVYGALARGAGLTTAEATLSSGLVFAGASQFVALGLWTAPLPIATIVLTTLIVNLRHLLLGAALRGPFAGLSRAAAYGSLFFLNDESWALTMGDYARGGRAGLFLLGSGLVVYPSWLAATLAGALAGGALPDPARLGLDFAFTAVILALLAGLRRGRADVPSWAVAAAVAIVAARALPGAWYVLLGALAGSLAGTIAGPAGDGG